MFNMLFYYDVSGFVWREGIRMLRIVVCKNELFEDVFCCFKCLVLKIGML